jgi:hypothetical protein
LAWDNHAEILFEFRLEQHSALRDIRINVVDLLFATLLARDSTTIRCRIVPPDGSDPVQTTFTLRSLRINVFLLLSHVIEASLRRRSKRCPAVYINGDGFAVETINPGREVSQLLLDAAKLISEQMKGVIAGEEYVRKFINIAPRQSSSRYLHVKRALSMPYLSLIGVWGRLREFCWSETGQAYQSQEYEGFGCIGSEAQDVNEADATEEEQTAVALAEEY